MKNVFETAGEVREVDLLAAFVAVWRNSTSGSLRFSRAAASAGFDLAEGNVVAVDSSEPRFETAAILTRAGKLDAKALERLSVAPGTDAALAALSAGLLTKREWKWGEKIRAIEILADLLSWPDGKYEFDPDARPKRGEFALTVPRLLLELFLRSRDRHLIEHQLGATDVPLVRSATFEEEFATFGLTADAESVVRLIDGQATATEISERAPAEEFAVLKLLAALKTLGLIATEPAVLAPPATAFPQPESGAGTEASPLESWTAPSLPSSSETPEEERQADFAPAPSEEPEYAFPGGQEREVPWNSRESVADERPSEERAEERELPAPERIQADAQWDLAAEPEPLDRPLESTTEASPPPRAPGRPWGVFVGAGLLVLIAAVAGTVLLRSRWIVPGAVTVGRRQPTAPVAAAAPTVVFTAPPAPSAQPTSAPTSLPTQSRAETTPRPSAARGTASAPAPATAEGRASWVERARRDQQKLQSNKKTRYAIQLELVCEVDSLAEAWKHDRPTGSLWLLTTPHDGRECFRVLWGRYASIQAARQAKPGIPSYFITSNNHPAVTSVR